MKYLSLFIPLLVLYGCGSNIPDGTFKAVSSVPTPSATPTISANPSDPNYHVCTVIITGNAQDFMLMIREIKTDGTNPAANWYPSDSYYGQIPASGIPLVIDAGFIRRAEVPNAAFFINIKNTSGTVNVKARLDGVDVFNKDYILDGGADINETNNCF